MTETRIVEINVIINKSADSVFKALTDAEQLKSWFATEVENNPRPGSRFLYTFRSRDTGEVEFVRKGTYSEVLENSRISHSWIANDLRKFSMVNFVLYRESESRTAVTLRHWGFFDDEESLQEYERAKKQWPFFMNNLKSYLERGVDERESVMGIKGITVA
ncbi:SRPBCC domain-containing protein [bacterium]|nr:SRPBCC domain-containing protein [bacterium]